MVLRVPIIVLHVTHLAMPMIGRRRFMIVLSLLHNDIMSILAMMVHGCMAICSMICMSIYESFWLV